MFWLHLFPKDQGMVVSLTFQPPTLQTDGEFGYPAAGAPSWDHEADDDHIWYFNGTPASLVAFGLQYVIPKYGDNVSIDMVVAGPNEGLNSGSMFTLSGTIEQRTMLSTEEFRCCIFWLKLKQLIFKDSLDLNDPLEPSTYLR